MCVSGKTKTVQVKRIHGGQSVGRGLCSFRERERWGVMEREGERQKEREGGRGTEARGREGIGGRETEGEREVVSPVALLNECRKLLHDFWSRLLSLFGKVRAVFFHVPCVYL